MKEQEFKKRLGRLRKKIDQADERLLKALEFRFEAVEQIGKIKKEMGVPIIQKARWKDVMKNRLRVAQGLGISPLFTNAFFQMIQKEAIRLQKKRR